MASKYTASKKFTDKELRDKLTAEQYRVTQKAGTERAFSGEYHDTKDDGVYHCVVCDEELFSSETKYDSGTGWPSFWAPVGDDKVKNRRDFKMIIPRTENRCGNCGSHLGHVFKDRGTVSKARYCMNSASLKFVPRSDND